MSVQQRPNAVTAIAICNFLFGGLGLLSLLCVGIGAIFLVSMAGSLPNQPDGSPNPLKDLGAVFTSIPGYVPFLIVSSILGTIMAILLIVSGFGLLKLRNWARIACMVYAVYTILSTIGGTVYQFTVVEPAMQKGMADFNAKLQKNVQKNAPPGAAPAPPMANPGGSAGAVMGGLFGIAYAVALLVILNLAHVKEAFRTGGVKVDEEAERGWGRGTDRYPDEGERYGRLRDDDDRIQNTDR